jgi:hypothetical protein
MEADALAQKPSLGAGGGMLIGLAAVASFLGYLAFITWLCGSIMTAIYGDYYRGSEYLKVSIWLAKVWYKAFFFGTVTTPVALIMATVTVFRPIARKAKIIIWIIVLGGALGYGFSLPESSHIIGEGTNAIHVLGELQNLFIDTRPIKH